MQIAWKLQLPEHARGLSRSRQSSLQPHFVSPSCNGSGCCIGAVQCNANARIYAQDNPLWQYIFRTSARWLTFTQQFSFKTRIAKYEVAEIFRDSEKWCERISTQIRFTNSNKSIGNKFCFFFCRNRNTKWTTSFINNGSLIEEIFTGDHILLYILLS